MVGGNQGGFRRRQGDIVITLGKETVDAQGTRKPHREFDRPDEVFNIPLVYVGEYFVKRGFTLWGNIDKFPTPRDGIGCDQRTAGNPWR